MRCALLTAQGSKVGDIVKSLGAACRVARGGVSRSDLLICRKPQPGNLQLWGLGKWETPWAAAACDGQQQARFFAHFVKINEILIEAFIAYNMADLSLISLDLIRKDKEPLDRKTKVICTLGPACWSVENLCKLINAGMNVARFNFSHGDVASHTSVLDRLREAMVKTGKTVLS